MNSFLSSGFVTRYPHGKDEKEKLQVPITRLPVPNRSGQCLRLPDRTTDCATFQNPGRSGRRPGAFVRCRMTAPPLQNRDLEPSTLATIFWISTRCVTRISTPGK